MQSVTSYTFLWFLPDYVNTFGSNKYLKYLIKAISFLNLLMIYVAWMISIWTLFNVGGILDIIDMIMTPLGIVFVLEVDDWIVKIYLMLQFDDDDGDESYDGGEILWVVETNRKHINRFKWAFFGISWCMLLPPIVIRLYMEYLTNKYPIQVPDDHIFSDSYSRGIFSGGIAIVTYTTLACTITLFVIIRIGVMCYFKRR
eukprot:UN07975